MKSTSVSHATCSSGMGIRLQIGPNTLNLLLMGGDGLDGNAFILIVKPIRPRIKRF
jgi:hypothetical protein